MSADALRDAARELAETADAIRTASVHATAALTGTAPMARRRPGLKAQRALLRAVTNPRGLGAPAGGPLGTLGAKLGGALRAESLAVRVLTTSLRLRIAAVTLSHPELDADPLLRRLNDAVDAGREIEAARALVALVRDRGAARALTALAPVFGEILALRALRDRSPLNDRTAWLIATGTATATADPLTGLSNRAVAALDVGTGAARRTVLAPDERLAADGSLLGFLGNIGVLGPTGRVAIQAVRGPDGVERYVVQVPGMRLGRPDDASPADLLGAFSATVRASGPYSRALGRAVADCVPDGAEIAVIGHSAGGAAALSLAQDAAFCARWTVTHLVAVGSPVDFKHPADPRTWVASITNQHDLIPTLDGQGAGNCFDLHPDWYVVDYTDPSHVFPQCHSIEHYTRDLAENLPAARDAVDARLSPFRGPVTRTHVYQLYDSDGGVTRRVATAHGPVELPVRCDDGYAVTAYFAVAAAGLPDGAVTVGGRAVVAVHVAEHRRGTLGRFGEASVGVVVRAHGLGTCVLASVQSAGLAHAVATEVFGQPATPGDVRAGGGARWTRAEVDADGPVLTLAGALGPGVPVVGRAHTVCALKDGTVVPSYVEERGPRRAHPAPGLRLTVGPSDHRLARHLRELGLDGARPVFCVVARAHRSLRSVPG
ncbi:hypothetical protein BTM25_03990 [Actinomadura rubteroloni]|uniref:Fungal lipase-like domain-containing protein n=1 Tax=Actinomadura rubteroloni TaxID=1926885 RepID=A0A2P4ULU3_9ACTN|nr:hypothetical protein [Actinomadura rubteroloni]POM26015.1 hypothetical protein BTM25_03990 [Actinomadura rubteroloni]